MSQFPRPRADGCFALRLFRAWRRARALGEHEEARRWLSELRLLAERPDRRDCWRWNETEERRGARVPSTFLSR